MRLNIKERLGDKFETISNVIQSDEIENQVKEYIENLSKIIQYTKPIISSRVVLSAYLIHFCHEEVLSIIKNPIEEFLKKKSSDLVLHLETDINDRYKQLCMIERLSNYNRLFHEWKKKDVESQLEIYLELYDNYQKMGNNILSSMIYSAIKYLKKEDTEQVIREYKNENKLKSISDSIEYSVVRNMKEAYWNSVELTDKQYSEWIDEINDYFIKIYSKMKNTVEWNDFKSSFDPEYLKLQVELKQFEWKKMIIWILSKIYILDASYQYETNRNMIRMLKESELHDDMIRKYMRYLFERLEYILAFLN